MKHFDEPEGASPLNPDEMEGLKFKHITTRGELDHLEQANIQEGLQWLARQKTPDIANSLVRCCLVRFWTLFLFHLRLLRRLR